MATDNRKIIPTYEKFGIPPYQDQRAVNTGYLIYSKWSRSTIPLDKFTTLPYEHRELFDGEPCQTGKNDADYQNHAYQIKFTTLFGWQYTINLREPSIPSKVQRQQMSDAKVAELIRPKWCLFPVTSTEQKSSWKRPRPTQREPRKQKMISSSRGNYQAQLIVGILFLTQYFDNEGEFVMSFRQRGWMNLWASIFTCFDIHLTRSCSFFNSHVLNGDMLTGEEN